jgi:hypothetical protein
MRTFIFPRVVTVLLAHQPAKDSNALNQPTKKGKWEEGKTNSSQSGNSGTGSEQLSVSPQSPNSSQPGNSGTGSEQLSVGFECLNESGGSLGFDLGYGFIKGMATGTLAMANYYRLDPKNISSRLLGNNFDGVGGNAVETGRVDQDGGFSGHGHYVRFAEGNEKSNNPELNAIVYKSLLLEVIKRMLEGSDVQIGGKNSIGSLMPDNLTQTAESNGIVKAIKTLLTGSGDRNAAANYINQTIISEGLASGDSKYYLEVLPPISTDASWSEDFLNILLFWTGSTTLNTCVFQNDGDVSGNFLGGEGVVMQAIFPNSNRWTYVIGYTPLILLNTTDPITLTPDFTNTKIVYAEKAFTDGTGWAFPAGKKQPFYYRYDFIEPFTKTRAGTMCARKADLPSLTASIGKAYKLTPDEANTLS